MIIFFIIYLPVGLSILCEWQQDPLTKLYNYSNCLGKPCPLEGKCTVSNLMWSLKHNIDQY